MRHHPGQLRLRLGRLNRPQVHKHRPARQRKRIDLLARHDVKVVRPLIPRRDCHQLRPKLSHILRYRRAVRQHRHLLEDLCRHLRAFGNLLLLGKRVLAGNRLKPRPRRLH